MNLDRFSEYRDTFLDAADEDRQQEIEADWVDKWHDERDERNNDRD